MCIQPPPRFVFVCIRGGLPSPAIVLIKIPFPRTLTGLNPQSMVWRFFPGHRDYTMALLASLFRIHVIWAYHDHINPKPATYQDPKPFYGKPSSLAKRSFRVSKSRATTRKGTSNIDRSSYWPWAPNPKMVMLPTKKDFQFEETAI